MWTHFVYLLLLPTLAVVSAIFMFEGEDLWTAVLIAGFPPVLMYSLFLANGYTIPNSVPIASFVVLAVPLQIAISVLLWGGGSIWLFFAENAAVEICAFVLGVMLVALRNRSTEYPSGSFLLISLVPVILFVGGVIPHLLSVFYGYGGWSFWMIFFLTAFGTAFWDYTKVYNKLTTAYLKTGESQNLEMRFDSAIASKLFKVPPNVELLSPLWNSDAGNEMNRSVLIVGFVAMFLPVPVGTIVAGILGRL